MNANPEAAHEGPSPSTTPSDLTPYLDENNGIIRLNLLVDGLHCGGCVNRIETALAKVPGVVEARANLTTRRLSVAWKAGSTGARDLMDVAEGLGFTVAPFDPERLERGDAAAEKELLRSMAIAGFAAANVMLLSVSVWAGHFQDMGPATRDLMHWVSALIALPAIAYAGRPFFRSAVSAVRTLGLNMDVPISLAVVLAAGMSLFETVSGGEHAYFDSAVTLLFFLLIGRYLDRRARGRARSAAENLVALSGKAVTIVEHDGTTRVIAPEAVSRGMVAFVATGDRIPVDGIVQDGRSDIDASLISGESLPQPVAPGDKVFAGMVNLTSSLRVTVSAVGEGTLLAEIARLMEVAESHRDRRVALADRVVRIYAPVVHIAALATFVAWMMFSTVGWQVSLNHAIAVLIVTCPCALALAVPVVQVVASGRLMRNGILLKSGMALERLAEVDTVVFDKTGTLTLGRPEIIIDGGWSRDDLRAAARLAGASRHPLAQAIVRAAPRTPVAADVEERPGAGLLMATEAGEVRLGSRSWCDVKDTEGDIPGPELWFARPGHAPVRFTFRDELRPDAAQVVAGLRKRGLSVELLSGDRAVTVAGAAEAAGIDRWHAGQSPVDKARRIEAMSVAGQRVCMVGDGLNDAPALAAAEVSLSPSTAADISQTSADIVFQGTRLSPVLQAIEIAKASGRLVRQNFALAFGYNIVTVPLAMAGFVTPLIAAIAMSASSIAVVANALRLGWRR